MHIYRAGLLALQNFLLSHVIWGICKPISCCIGQRSNNFIVGLTDVSPTVRAPTLWNYDVCGQYPGAVPNGATVSLQCKCNMAAHSYVVLQFPINAAANFCELEVFIRS